MNETIQVDIVTPEKKIFSENDIVSVTVPGIEGEMGILHNHIPIISFLKPGTINIETKNKETKFFIADGVLEFNNNIVTILASEIYDLATINAFTIDQLKQKSKEKIQKENQSDNDIFLAEKFEEEVNRLTSVK
jgi:F-type H+-transporting ATPase subunit epsilon